MRACASRRRCERRSSAARRSRAALLERARAAGVPHGHDLRPDRGVLAGDDRRARRCSARACARARSTRSSSPGRRSRPARRDPTAGCTRATSATLDERGHLTVTGRAADTIVTGGENVAPTEVEDVLATHPAVADVAVHGTPGRRVGRAHRRNDRPLAGRYRNGGRADGLLSCPTRAVQGAQRVQVLPRLAEDAVRKAPAPRSGGMNATNGPSSLADNRRCCSRHARRPRGGAGGHVHGQGR